MASKSIKLSFASAQQNDLPDKQTLHIGSMMVLKKIEG